MILADYNTRVLIVEDKDEVQELMRKSYPNGTIKSFEEKTVYKVTIEYRHGQPKEERKALSIWD